MFQRTGTSRINGLSFNRLIPNILTVFALCAGLTSMRFGLSGKWEAAVFSILLAGLLDGLDGRVARLLHCTSKFGAELDSLADFISFGVAPAMLLYLWTIQKFGGLGWALILLYTVCMAMRLARFNTMIGQPDLPPWAYNFFTGVPAPAASSLVLMPMIASFQFDPGSFFELPLVSATMLVFVSFMMISNIPTWSGKKWRIPNHLVLPAFLFVAIFAACLVTSPWATVTTLGLLYLCSIPLSFHAFNRLQREAVEASGEEILPPSLFQKMEKDTKETNPNL